MKTYEWVLIAFSVVFVLAIGAMLIRKKLDADAQKQRSARVAAKAKTPIRTAFDLIEDDAKDQAAKIIANRVATRRALATVSDFAEAMKETTHPDAPKA